jgi:TonB family protein
MTKLVRVVSIGAALLCSALTAAQTDAVSERAKLVIDFGFDYFGAVAPPSGLSDTPADSLARRAKEFWSVPSDLQSARAHVVATMTIDEKGVVSDITIVQPSPIDAFNTAASNALAPLNPTPLLPEHYPLSRVRITATFFVNEASTPGPVQSPGDWPPTGTFRVGNGVTVPRVLTEVKPQYTRLALKAGIQGTMLTELVVQKDGTVGRVIVLRSLDQTFGLDQEAITAARQWKFIPATRMGEPVDVLISIELTFTMK